MPIIRCYIGVRDQEWANAFAHLGTYADYFRNTFGKFSRSESGTPGIDFRLDPNLYILPAMGNVSAATPGSLNDGLNQLLGGTGDDDVFNNTRIGLLIANRFSPKPSLLGYMFDTGRNRVASDDYRPRMGAAVFAQSIAKMSQNEDYWQRFLHTAVHELAHVFNVSHSLPARGHFMTPKAIPAPLANQDFRFQSKHVRFMSRCGTHVQVHPGGAPWGIREPLDRDDGSASLDGSRSDRLKLIIAPRPRRFYYFDPVELDITLSARQKSVRVSDEVDPGYEAFTIWIEDPVGKRYAFRPPRHYCLHARKLTIEFGTPFKRDISIGHGQSGFTFKAPGRYKIYVTMQISKGEHVKSNVSHLESVKVPRKLTKLESSMTDLRVVNALYYRQGDFGQGIILALERLCETHPDTAVRGTIESVLAHRYLRMVEDVKTDRAKRNALKQAESRSRDAVAHIPSAWHRNRKAHEISRAVELLTAI